MGKVVVLGVFVADTVHTAARMPRMGETVLGRSFALGPGGKGSNQAVAAARVGAEVAIISRLGADDFGQMALNTWAEAGVQPYAEQSYQDYTGSAFVFIDESTGDNAIIIAPGAAANISAEDLAKRVDVIAAADVFVTQLEQPLEAAQAGLQIAKAAGVKTVLNPAPAAALSKEILSLCDFITPNESEAESLTGIDVRNAADAQKAAQILHRAGVQTPIITMGEQGAYLHGVGMIPAFEAGPVAETTGAGDAFNGGFAAALAEGRDVREAVTYGCATAAISVTRAGAAPSMPRKEEVDQLIRFASS